MELEILVKTRVTFSEAKQRSHYVVIKIHQQQVLAVTNPTKKTKRLIKELTKTKLII